MFLIHCPYVSMFFTEILNLTFGFICVSQGKAWKRMWSTILFFRIIMNTHESDVHTISPELPAMFDGMKLAAVATVLYIIVRCLNLKSPTAPPDLTYQDTPLNLFLLKSCPQLTKEWVAFSVLCLSLKVLPWKWRCCPAIWGCSEGSGLSGDEPICHQWSWVCHMSVPDMSGFSGSSSLN